MSKSKRLMELMMAVNHKRKFTVKELSQEFGVSQRTILRDLQELSELGVPLYSEVGPHGGYRVLKERILPPIAFSEEEAVAIFFSIHALRHYSSLPFEADASSALRKFYHYMAHDTRDRIDQMKSRVDFVTPTRQAHSPYLSILLDAAIQQKVLLIDYEALEKRSSREIQPIGIYTRNGLWYCPAYCFQSDEFRVFRCDRMFAVTHSTVEPLDLRHVHLENRQTKGVPEQEVVALYAELTKEGAQMCEAEPWPVPKLHIRKDGTGWLEGNISKSDMLFFAKFFIGLGHEVTIESPPELLDCIKRNLSELLAKYD
ncbi:Predicted DNA-binding transcriptional regulator YafY, contains an HTH and WYL domains [Paenibacillus algorifonticola]|uniref:Predicted DNA-binding transcriptional regulator YafY, contains an HTH and WYL domains n=1 Tax=Paenibacillus algorifonticola TaxID=684063 RepID=A0A1I2FPT4_9BACL|nr:YafY family protein [Paenibacillus algorifonticola]SFF07504.1 Predicted DNA-binding transcriptional regulator YafY, contains an HTH and WYL domains [Paenibacillus algorifonticola]